MSIYDFLLQQYDNKEPYAGAVLPDHGQMRLASDEVWTAGAYEGIVLRENYGIKQHVLVNYRIARIIRKQIENPCEKNQKKAYDTIRKYSAISIVDPVISIMLSRHKIDKDKMRQAALDMAMKSEHREVVKFGVALLGHCAKEEDIPVIMVIGRHEEFTLYAAGAIHVMTDSAKRNDLLIQLSENTNGWGKIAVAYEIDYTSEAARFYTVAKGCENGIGLSYLSNVCATKGKMTEIMQAMLDGQEAFGIYTKEDMFNGICTIFTGLLEKHPTNDDISNYKYAKKAAKLFKEVTDTYPDLSEKNQQAAKIIDELRYYLM